MFRKVSVSMRPLVVVEYCYSIGNGFLRQTQRVCWQVRRALKTPLAFRPRGLPGPRIKTNEQKSTVGTNRSLEQFKMERL